MTVESENSWAPAVAHKISMSYMGLGILHFPQSPGDFSAHCDVRNTDKGYDNAIVRCG